MAIWDNSSSPVSSTDMGLVVKPPPEGRNPVVLPPGQLETERDLGTLQDTAVGVGQGATFGNLSDVSQGLVPQQVIDLARTRSPTSYLVGETVGGALPAVAASRLGIAVPQLATRFGAGPVIRGLSYPAEGAVYGAAQGAHDDNAGAGAAMGAVFGVASPFVGAGAGQVARGLPSTKAPASLVDAVRTDLPGFNAGISRGNPRFRMADAGPSLLTEAQGAAMPGPAQYPSTGRAALINDLTQRNVSVDPHIVQQTESILGPGTNTNPNLAISRQGERLTAELKAIGDEYDPLLANARAVDTQQLANDFEARAISDRGPGQAAFRQARAMLDITGAPGNLDPSPATLQATRSAIRNMMKDPANAAQAGALRYIDQRLTDELQAKVPGIWELDSRYAEKAAQRAALGLDYKGDFVPSLGNQMLAKGQSGYVHPVTFADKLAEQAEPKGPNIGPSAEPYYTKQASRADIDRLLGTHKSDLPALQTAIGNRTDDNFEKLATLFGRQRAQEYMAMLEQEAAGRNTYNKVVENSQTPARLLAVKRQEGSDLPTAGESLWGNVKAATKYVYDKATAEHRAAVRDRIAEIMAADNPAAMQAHVDQLLRIGAKRDARDAMASILAQRTFLGGATAGVIPKQAEAQY